MLASRAPCLQSLRVPLSAPGPAFAVGASGRLVATAEGPEGAAAGSKSVLAKIWEGTYPRVLSKAHTTLEDSDVTPMTRWSVLMKGLLVQIPGGAIYTWSMWQGALATSAGVVAASAADWTFSELAVTFPFLAVGYGAAFGPMSGWIERAGPRYASVVGAVLYGIGHAVAAVGAYFHYLPFVWVGWGLLGGFGSGLGFSSPQSTLMKWFPDKKGLATGISIGAYASGSIFMAPIIDRLLTSFFRAPTFAGAADAVELKTENGIQFVKYQGSWEQAVCATSADLAKLPGEHASNLLEGFYLVGTGSSGVMASLAAVGAGYTVCMLWGAVMLRAPPANYMPEGFSPDAVKDTPAATHLSAGSGIVATGNVPTEKALKTPQFWLLWFALSCSCTAGAAVLSNSKFILVDVFSLLYPNIVTGAFTGGFIGFLGIANAGGRVGWATLSDWAGRKNALMLCCLSMPVCLTIPQLAPLAIAGKGGVAPLVAFCGCSFFIVTSYGGVLALMPSYSNDLFGSKNAGEIYGWAMTGWTTSAMVGPSLIAYCRETSYSKAVQGLVATIPPSTFEQTFKAPMEKLPELISANTVTIPRLLEIAPAGTMDPTPYLYDSTFYSLAVIITAAALSNAAIRRVDPSLYLPEVDLEELASEADPKEEVTSEEVKR